MVDAPLDELTSGGRTLDEIFTEKTARDVATEDAAAAVEGDAS